MPVHRAAQSAEELALLRTVVADLSDTVALSVYNDWLEEQGDKRGPFLREFMRAFAAKETLPPIPDHFSPTWAEVLALPIRRRLRTPITMGDGELQSHYQGMYPDGFAAYEPYLGHILGDAVAAVQMRVGASARMRQVPVGVSRAGGVPDLPAGMVWPTFEGWGGIWPAQFMFQLDLADLRGTFADGMLPDEGLLSVFLYLSDEHLDRRVLVFPAGTKLYRPEAPRPYRWHRDHGAEFRASQSDTVYLSDALRFGMQTGPANVEPPLWNLLDGWADADEPHWLCTPWKEEMCEAWDCCDAPAAYLELLHLWENHALRWGFGDGNAFHAFVKPEDARLGRFTDLVCHEVPG